MNEVLKSLCIEKGTDPSDWTADNRREAVVELLRSNASFITDAVNDMPERELQAVTDALSHHSPAMRHAALGLIFERTILAYPLDHLQATCEDHEGEWISEDHRAALRNEADSLNDARRA